MSRQHRLQFGTMNLQLAALVLSVAVFGFVPLTADQQPAPSKPKWKLLFDEKTLENWKPTQFGGEGEVKVVEGTIVMEPGSELTGITWIGGPLPKMNYEVSIVAQRIEGHDFFCGLTFQVNDDPCSLVIGGWGGGVVGISSLNGEAAAYNETARFESFDQKKWYTIRLRVIEEGLMAWIDNEQVVGVSTKGKTISVHPAVEPSRPFGVACFATKAGVKEIKIRDLTAEEATAKLTPAEDKKKSDAKKANK